MVFYAFFVPLKVERSKKKNLDGLNAKITGRKAFLTIHNSCVENLSHKMTTLRLIKLNYFFVKKVTQQRLCSSTMKDAKFNKTIQILIFKEG